MRSQRFPLRHIVLGTAACAASAAAHAQAFPQKMTFSIDWQGPTIAAPDSTYGFPITEGDILAPATATGLPAFGPLPVPNILFSAGFAPAPGLGLAWGPGCAGHPPGVPCKVEVDALDYGRVPVIGPNQPVRGRLVFSPDEFAKGIPGMAFPPNVLTEAPFGDSCSDGFLDIGLGAGPLLPFAAPNPGNTGVIDGNGLVSGSGFMYKGLGVIEPNPAGVLLPNPGDNVDALAALVSTTGGFPLSGIYFSLDAAFPDPLTGTPNSGSAAAHGFPPGAVLKSAIAGGPPIVWAGPGPLGLDFFGPGTDDLDALVLHENGNGVYNPSVIANDWLGGGTDMLLFSVRRGSAVVGLPDSNFGLPISEGDILTTPRPTAFGGLSPFPGIYFSAENLGLLTKRSFAGLAFNDELDALDLLLGSLFDCNGNGLEDAFDIASGTSTDVNKNGVPDECELFATPYCFCPPPLAPCGNFYAPGGCKNSTPVGAILTASGTTSVANDDLVLTTTQMPTFKPGLLFQGKTASPPVFFFDGLRCVGQPIFRHPVKNSGATGSFTYGPGLVAFSLGFPPAGHIMMGDTWYWQTWYRDPFGPCGTGANTSNAVKTTFTP